MSDQLEVAQRGVCRWYGRALVVLFFLLFRTRHHNIRAPWNAVPVRKKKRNNNRNNNNKTS